MAVTLPTTDPVNDYHRPLSPGRLLLVANSDLPWSLALTRKVAKRHRIPAANILTAAMGTNLDYWDAGSNANLLSQLLTPIADAWTSVAAQGVFMGPGTPQRLAIRGESDGLYPAVGSAIGKVSAANLVAGARRADWWADSHGGAGLCWVNAGNGHYAGLCIPAVNFFEMINPLQWRFALTAATGADYPTYGTQYNGLGSELYVLPNQTAIDLLGDPGNIQVLQGRFGVGWTQDDFALEGSFPDEFTETSALAGQVLHRALNYAAAVSPANRYQQPIHVHLGTGIPTYAQTLSWLVAQLRTWGYPCTYTDRTQGFTADMLTYTPYSGAAYTGLDINLGRVRDYPYHLMLGSAANNEMVNPPYRDAWQPSAGGGSYLGPSEGWQYCLRGLARGGAGGASNALHVTTRTYGAQISIAYNLLRGMCWSEAVYYSSYPTGGEILPTGDPLSRPFPREYA